METETFAGFQYWKKKTIFACYTKVFFEGWTEKLRVDNIAAAEEEGKKNIL